MFPEGPVICYLAGNLLNLAVVGQHLRHMQHEGRAGKWKRVKLFKENWPMLRKRTFLKNHKSTMDNGHI